MSKNLLLYYVQYLRFLELRMCFPFEGTCKMRCYHVCFIQKSFSVDALTSLSGVSGFNLRFSSLLIFQREDTFPDVLLGSVQR
jgi:hypothetical protein